VASGDAQFASGGSFGELVAFAAANEADLVGVTVDARVPIDTLIVKPGQAETLEDLSGTTIGVKGRLPTSLEVMLGEAGLAEGTDYETVLLDGFDPLAHIAIPDIVGFSGWKSNEPGTLERADVPFDTFDPVDYDVPGSFGVIFTSLDFLAEHPTAAEDFVRATLRGLADAVEDPEAAAATAVALINETGNPNFLSAEGETFRWSEEAELIVASTPEGSPLAVPDDVSLQAELDAGAGVGLFGDSGEAPSAAASIAPDITSGVYDANGEVIWPG
jgi:NitT/TauT family transport system substrate-binding protein